MIDLYRFKNGKWALIVKDTVEGVFSDIEEASEHMLTLGVKDDEIDTALVSMAVNEHHRAHFGSRGFFIFSDENKLD